MTLAALPPEAYLWFKTLHIVGVVVWFAGLFYLVRLFIYHREAEELEPGLRTAFQAQYGLMEKRLANIIATPGMLVAVSMAIGLLVANPAWLQQSWMHAKLALVFVASGLSGAAAGMLKRAEQGDGSDVPYGKVRGMALGLVAYRAGKKLKYDGKTGRTDDAGANQFLGRKYRDGWLINA